LSATNRGSSRNPQDFYETPRWLTEAIIPHLRPYAPQRILEPAAGHGAIVRLLESAFPEAEIDTGDVSTGQDFLVHPYPADYDLIMTNPPYSLALDFIQRALDLRRTEQSVVGMLLRVNFAGGQARAPFFRRNKPSIYITPRRPDFTGGGGDATEYAWFVWDGRQHNVEWLDTENGASQGSLFGPAAPMDGIGRPVVGERFLRAMSWEPLEDRNNRYQPNRKRR
jgi:hypothetical protein